jgi:DNA-binding response OmpR family regulator
MNHRILIVEDEQLLAEAMKEFLSSAGYDVDCAAEREEAEALLAHYSYALVITDLALTDLGLTGVDILDNLADQAKRPKVIVYSGHPGPDLESQLASHGVDVYLQKPQPLGELVRVASQLLGCSA